MRFEDFVGVEQEIRRIREGVLGKSPSHAHLFTGPEGTGKRSMAGICARALHCAGEEKPCDNCPPCKRMLAGTHPDHIVVRSEKATLGVEEIRALIERLSLRPFEGGSYTVLIEDADRMTPQAQNALLKTLESPPSGAVFFLTANSTASLLPTILSRVRTTHFEPPSVPDAERALERAGVEKGAAAVLARAAQGSVGLSLRMREDKEFLPLRERALGALGRLKATSDAPLAAASLAGDKDSARMLLLLYESAALALMRAEARGAPADGALIPAGTAFTGDKLLAQVFEARKMLKSNVAFANVMELFFLNLVEV